MSDIASLPKANACLFHVEYGKFKSTEARTKLQEHVNASYPQERVKPLTRQDIADYGKGKGIMVEVDPNGKTQE